MLMGKGVEPFNLKQDLISRGVGTCIEYTTKDKDITLWRIVQGWPTILVTFKGLLINNPLGDIEFRIDPTFNVLVSEIGNLIYQRSSTKVDILDRCLASHFGVIEKVAFECFDISISMDLHVIILEVPSCSLVLVRPWMQELRVIQNWSMMKLSPSKGRNIFYDLYLQREIKCI